MPGTFTQIYIQVVFAVKGRENLIAKPWRSELHKYIAGIVTGKGKNPLSSMALLTTFIALLG